MAENYDEAEAFLEDCFAVVADNLDDVRAYMEEEGMDVEEMSDAELEEQSEVFALPDGQYILPFWFSPLFVLFFLILSVKKR